MHDGHWGEKAASYVAFDVIYLPFVRNESFF